VRRLTAATVWAGLALLVLAPAAGAVPDSPQLPVGPLHPAGRWIKDATGRVVIVHGLELARKTPPYFAPAASFSAHDAQNIEDWGFDAVRVGWFWKGLEPQRGQINSTYLDQLVREASLLAGHHVFTLLEAHQDGYNEQLGGAGFPDWATISDGTWAPVETVPGTGVLDLQAARAFDNLYANSNGIADAFAHAWAVMAGRFRHNPMMLGYDLFNEPAPGSQWATCAQPAGCPAFDAATLQPIEDKLAAAVRSGDPTTIAFYEPNIYFDSGVASWLRPPPAAAGPSGFAFHDYCLAAALSGQPDHESTAPGYPACQPADRGVFANARRTATVMGVPALFDEFGDTQDLAQVSRMIRLADAHLTGWMYWGYKDWVDDPGGQGSGPLFDDSDDGGTLRPDKLAALSEPYPMATAGTPLSERYDPATQTFTYTYRPDRRISAPTVLFTAPIQYPHGYRVQADGARVTSAPGAPYLSLAPGAHTVLVHVRLTPASPGAAAPPPGPGPAGAASGSAPAPAAPLQLGTASGSCDGNADRPAVVRSPLVAAGQTDVVAQVQTARGAGELTADSGVSVAYGAGDTAWLDLGPVPAGDSAAAAVICRWGPATYDFSFGLAPTLPASFSGRSTRDVNVSLGGSRLAFVVPAAGHYVADVDLAGGPVEIGLRRADGSTPPATRFGASGSADLGDLSPGPASLDVTPLPGGPARWTISVHAAAG
jgi:endoglycosylceramidase